MQKDQRKHLGPHGSILARTALLCSLLLAVSLGLLASARAQTTAGIVTLYNLGDSGFQESGGLIQATDGNFYGTNSSGGFARTGFAYKVTSRGVFTKLHDFSDTAAGGQRPEGSLVQGNDGNFYGVTRGGGDNNSGVVFQLTPTGGYTVLCSLPGGGYRLAQPGMVKGLDGDFYGVSGGTSDTQGIVFKVNSTGVFTILHSFHNDLVDQGSTPSASLIVGSDGNFYGTTVYGGTNNTGTVFKMTPAGTVTILHSFIGATNNTTTPGGILPNGSLVQGLDGNFYGTTEQGGTGQGTVFKITPDGVFTNLYNFNPTGSTLSQDGGYMNSGLTLGPDGNFYGLNGTFFQITPAGVETVLTTAGTEVRPSLVVGTDGNFYGANYTQAFKVVLNPAYGTLQFAASSYSVNENAGSVTLAVTRVGGDTGSVSVYYDTVNDTARAGQDFKHVEDLLTWMDGDVAPKTITVPIYDRGISDGSTRKFSVALSDPDGGATLGTPTAATVTINENDPGTTAKPVITSALTANGVVRAAFSYQITASNAPTSFGATGLPDGLSVNAAGLISGTPTAAGAYPVTISATNGGGTGTATLTITVAPVSTSAGTADLTISVVDSPDPVLVGGQVRYVFTINNKGPDKATNLQGGFVKDAKMTLVTASSVPGILVTNTNVLSFPLPDLASGASESYTLVFTADGAGIYTVAGGVQADQTDPHTADNSLLTTTEAKAGSTAAHAPVITAAPGGEIIVGEVFSYQITTDGTVAVDAYTVTGLPTGLSVNASTGLIAGTLPAETAAGTFTVTLRAANGAGASTATRTFTVVAAPTGPKVIDVTAAFGANTGLKLIPDKGKYKFTGSLILSNLGTKAFNGVSVPGLPPKTPLSVGLYLSNSPTFSYPLTGDAAAGLLPLAVTVVSSLDATTGIVSYSAKVVVPTGNKTASLASLPIKLGKAGKLPLTLPFSLKASAADLPAQVTSGQYRYLLVVVDPAGAIATESSKSNNTAALDLQTLLGGD